MQRLNAKRNWRQYFHQKIIEAAKPKTHECYLACGEYLTRIAYKIAFITQWGVFVATVMMFGLKNAPATFQRMVQEIFNDYLTNFMKVFVDNFSVAGDKAKHLFHLRLCPQRCRDTRLKRNPQKIPIKSGVLLGHIVSREGITIDQDKVKAIQEMKEPTNSKQLEGFLGKVKWHARFVRYIAHVASPLYILIRKNASFIWMLECLKAFETLKKISTSTPVMVSPNKTIPCIYICICIYKALAGALLQNGDLGYQQPTYYISKTLTQTKKNYNTTWREALAVIYAITKFKHYLLGSKVVLHVDHQALIYIVNKASLVGRMARWMLTLQEFEFSIQHTLGNENAVVDFLSRLEEQGPHMEIVH